MLGERGRGARPCRTPCSRQSRRPASARGAPASAGRGAPWRGSRRPRCRRRGRRRRPRPPRGEDSGHDRSVDEHVVRGDLQRSDRPLHRAQGRPEDVDRVDLDFGRLGDRPADCGAGDDRDQRLAPAGVETLGIVDPADGRGPAGKTTAAATTGPASGPRPASSTPAIAGCSKRSRCKADDEPATEAASGRRRLPHSLAPQGVRCTPPQMGLFQRPARNGRRPCRRGCG